MNVAVVEAVGCDGATELIDHLGGDGDAAGIRGDARDALYIKGDVGAEEAAGAVVGDAEKGTAEGVEVGASWSAGVGEGEGSGALGSGVTGELAGESGAVGDGVVGVPRFLAPDIEDELGVGGVGEVGADQAAERVVMQDRGDAPLDELLLVLVFVTSNHPTSIPTFQYNRNGWRRLAAVSGCAGLGPTGALGLLSRRSHVRLRLGMPTAPA